MKIFQKKRVVKVEGIRYCKNKKCRCELRKNNDGDYCNNCQTKRDEKREGYIAGAGALLVLVLSFVVNPKKIIGNTLGKLKIRKF